PQTPTVPRAPWCLLALWHHGWYGRGLVRGAPTGGALVRRLALGVGTQSGADGAGTQGAVRKALVLRLAPGVDTQSGADGSVRRGVRWALVRGLDGGGLARGASVRRGAPRARSHLRIFSLRTTARTITPCPLAYQPAYPGASGGALMGTGVGAV